MSDLEYSIRREMARLLEASPLPPSLQRIAGGLGGYQPYRRKRRPFHVGFASLSALLVVTIFVLDSPSREMDTETRNVTSHPLIDRLDANDDGLIDLAEQPPIELDLPTTANTGLLLASTESRLYAASTDGLEGRLKITALDTQGGAPRIVIDDGPTGIPVALLAFERSLVAVVSRHLQNRPPVVAFSSDEGVTWAELPLPDPGGADETHYLATGAAVGDGSLVISNLQGVWVSSDQSSWDYVQIAGPDQHVTTLTWNGTHFVAGGGQADTADPRRSSSDQNLALWRSTDGQDWATAEVVPSNPAIRTADGVEAIVGSSYGTSLTITMAQRWDLGHPATEPWGTVITVTDDNPVSTAVHLPEWIFHHAEATSWGFITTAQATNDPTRIRLLASMDGISWHDLAPAPAVMMNATNWQGHLVINGYTREGLPNRTWYFSGDLERDPTDDLSG